jgi:hypothetical protein
MKGFFEKWNVLRLIVALFMIAMGLLGMLLQKC